MTDFRITAEMIFSIVQTEAKDLWKKEEDTEFLKKISEEIALYDSRILMASTVKEKELNKKNLEHLMTQIKGRVARRKNALIKMGDSVLTKIVNVTIKIIVARIGI